jgi:hypothetical protein
MAQDHIFEELFFDPFDQLMRLQLLASAMERENEMDADIVSVLLLTPYANRDLLDKLNSPRLACLGASVPAVWARMVQIGRFTYHSIEKLLECVPNCGGYETWAQYLQLRYGDMK